MIGSAKKIGKPGPRNKVKFPAGRSFFVEIRNQSLLTSAGSYVIGAGLGNFDSRVIFEHNVVGEASILSPVLRSSMKHLSNGTGSVRIELSLQDAITGNFSSEGAVPEEADCDGLGLTFEKPGFFYRIAQGDNANKANLVMNVSVRPSVMPTICSFFFGTEFYVIFDNPPLEINPNNISGVTIEEL